MIDINIKVEFFMKERCKNITKDLFEIKNNI